LKALKAGRHTVWHPDWHILRIIRIVLNTH
jgi:hypothetical protein